MQLERTRRIGAIPTSFIGAALLGLLIFLNLAAVLPAVHGLGHDDHGCDEPGCVVLLLANGSVEPALQALQPFGFEPEFERLPVARTLPVVVRDDCPLHPGRAPPA